MKKKQGKKLLLSKETLRALTNPSLAKAIAGNMPVTQYATACEGLARGASASELSVEICIFTCLGGCAPVPQPIPR
jgi:hypothetical protein